MKVMEYSNSPKHAALQTIADALGVPVERFFAQSPPLAAAVSAEECLRLWSEIRTEAGRQQALDALRMIAKLERK
jgi:transcriptional regulator with XRE-family HTH domain